MVSCQTSSFAYKLRQIETTRLNMNRVNQEISLRINNMPKCTVNCALAFLVTITLVCANPFTRDASAAASKPQQQFWITNAYGDDVQVYEVGTWKLIKTFKVGMNPHGISATDDGKTVHIAIENFKSKTGELIWIDTATFKITHRIAVGPRPNENECTPDGKWIYVPCADGNYWVIDGQQKKVVTKINTGGRPHNTTRSPDGKIMYLSPMGAPKEVTICDTTQNHKVIGIIPFQNSVRPPSISPDGKHFFQNIDNLIGFQVADIAKRKVIATVNHIFPDELKKKRSRCHGLGVRPDGKEVWSCNVEHHLVHVHELESNQYKQTHAIKMPGRIYWVCFSPDSKYCFASLRSSKQVAVIDCKTKKIVKLLEAGREPKRSQVITVNPSNSDRASLKSSAKPHPSQRWETAIAKFEAQDKANPSAKGGVLFVGSSSIRGWKLDKWFPNLKPLNRGFGGSQVEDSLYFADRIVINHQPRVIAMYAGDNDIAKGKTPQRVFRDYKAFVAKIHAALPKTRIAYIAIKPSISRWKLVKQLREANKLIADYSKSNDRLSFVDIDTPMMGSDNKPMKDLFLKDGLHLNEKGYELWTKVIRPHLK
jgi:DNA-binding beta-propeller fold protein YncE/lysophospholipase L1-like esterase